MNSKRIMAVILTAVLMVAGLAGGGITADAESTIQITGGATRNIEAEPGKVTHVKLPIVAVGEYILNPSVTAEPESGAPFSVTGVKLTKDNLEGTVPGISTGLTFTFTYNGANEEGMATTYKIPLDVNIQILTEKTPSQLTIDQIRYDENLVAIGGSFDLSFQVKNEGEIKALNTFVSIDYGDTGMVPGYTLESIKVGDLTEGVLQNVHIPINVLPTATEGLKTLKVNMTYKDSDGTEYSTSRNLYITILKNGTGDVNDANLILESSTYSDGILAGSDLTLQAVLTELLLAAPEGRVLGFGPEGPRRGPAPPHSQGIQEIHQGMEDFARDFLDLEGRLGKTFHISGRDAWAPMGAVCHRKNRGFQQGWEAWLDEDHAG